MFTVLLAAAAVTASVLFGWWLGTAISRHRQLSADDAVRLKRVFNCLYDVASLAAADVNQRATPFDAGTQPDNATSNMILASVMRLVEENEQMQKQLESSQLRLEQQQLQIRSHAEEARTDVLTGLVNRRGFDEELMRRVAEFRRHQRDVSILLLDVDHFKRVNDTYGHQVGDQVIRDVAELVKTTLRETEIVARIGGEEFAVLFPGANVHETNKAAERVRKAIASARFPAGETNLQVTISAGVAQLPSSSDQAIMIEQADLALYASKDAGRNCGHWHDGRQTLAIAPPEHPPHRHEPPLLPFVLRRPWHEFTGEVDRYLSSWETGRLPFAMILLRVVNFQEVVHEAGCDFGREITSVVAANFVARMGQMDVASRRTADTFGLLLPGAGHETAHDIAARLRNSLGGMEFSTQPGVSLTIDVSTTVPQEGDSSVGMVARAEQQLTAGVVAV